MATKLYFFNATSTKLFCIQGKNAINFLSKYKNWRELDADNDLMIDISNYFEKHGKLIGDYTNSLVSYV